MTHVIRLLYFVSCINYVNAYLITADNNHIITNSYKDVIDSNSSTADSNTTTTYCF